MLLIDNRLIPIESASVKLALNEIGDISITVPKSELPDSAILQIFKILVSGDVIIEGIVTDDSALKIKDGVVMVDLKGMDLLGSLMLDYYAKEDAHYQNVLWSIVLQDLLSVSDWTLADTSTLTDYAVTLDLRSKDTLWAQIKELTKSVSDAALRRAGTLSVDAGAFNDFRAGVIDAHNLLTPLEVTRKNNIPIKYLRPLSGRTGNEQTDVEGAVLIDETLEADADYPIVLDARGNYVIQNNTITAGRSITKTYNTIKTNNEKPPSAAEKREAAHGLYLKAKRDMEMSSSNTIKAKVLLREIPDVPSYWRIYGAVTHYVTNPITQAVIPVEISQADGDYYLIRASFNVADFRNEMTLDGSLQTGIVCDLEFSDVLQVAQSADELTQEKLEQFNADEPLGLTTISRQISVNHASVAADCLLSDGTDGKLFQFDIEATDIPDDAKSVYAAYTFSDTTVTWRVVASPSLSPVQHQAQLCVSGTGGADWDVSDDVTITTVFYFLI